MFFNWIRYGSIGRNSIFLDAFHHASHASRLIVSTPLLVQLFQPRYTLNILTPLKHLDKLVYRFARSRVRGGYDYRFVRWGGGGLPSLYIVEDRGARIRA